MWHGEGVFTSYIRFALGATLADQYPWLPLSPLSLTRAHHGGTRLEDPTMRSYVLYGLIESGIIYKAPAYVVAIFTCIQGYHLQRF
jgi:hypothetical protein